MDSPPAPSPLPSLGSLSTGKSSPAFFWRALLSPTELLQEAASNNVDIFTVFLRPSSSPIKTSSPHALKTNSSSHITNKNLIKEIRVSRAGFIIFKSTDISTALEACKIQKILNSPVSAFVPTDEFSSKFLIKGVPTDISLDFILEDLYSQNISPSKVVRFTRSSPSGPTPTRTILVELFGTRIPAKVTIDYENFPVSEFVGKPRQCANCWRFGHGSRACRSRSRCLQCEDCSQPPSACSLPTSRCPNCERNHQADSEQCPAFAKEKAILAYQ